MTDTHSDGISERRVLTTFDQVIGELGGVVKVGVLTKRSKSAVCNWRNTGALFPANQYRTISRALFERGCLVDINLFTWVGEKTDTPIIGVAA